MGATETPPVDAEMVECGRCMNEFDLETMHCNGEGDLVCTECWHRNADDREHGIDLDDPEDQF